MTLLIVIMVLIHFYFEVIIILFLTISINGQSPYTIPLASGRSMQVQYRLRGIPSHKKLRNAVKAPEEIS